MRKLVIGADGGGTKTALIALDAYTEEIVAQSEALGCNGYFSGWDEAAGHLLSGINALGLSPEDQILALGVGDPAMDDSLPEGSPLKEKLCALLPYPVFTKSDVFVALYAFTQGKAGALLIAGTGSMGVALNKPYCHQEEASLLTVGGWGLPSTDGGSAYSIAVKGIEAAFDAFDRIAPPTLLCDAVQSHFGAQTPRALIDIFNAAPLPRSRIASFAKEVDACARRGDSAALSVLKRAGNTLGRYGISLLEALPEDQQLLGLYGSVMQHNAIVRETLIATVKARFPDAAVGISQTPPQSGAALFALHALGGKE